VTFRRCRTAELMDRPDADPRELARSLDDLRRVNRWLGGRRGAVRLVLPIARRLPGRPVRILDVGTGRADIPLALVAAARREGISLAIIGIDLHPTTVDVARTAAAGDRDVEIAVGDALDLAYPDRSFDIAMSHTTLHHFSDEDAARAVAEMDRVAKWAVVVTDLARSRAAWLGSRILAATAWRRHPITRHDGPASVRAAFTPAELDRLAARSTPDPRRVRPEPIFRLSLVVDRTGATESGAGPMEPIRDANRRS
jgi:2-polyprenyl-3-methyl-5-hydroxy-6-metoxy-1,4-benzoquinol methylase